MKNEIGICEQFLVENGWKKDNEEGEACEFNSYSKDGSISVDISDEEIVFLGDSGDFLSLPLNYYALVGALIEYHQIGFNFVSVRHFL